MQASATAPGLSMDSRRPWHRRANIETDSYVIVPAATIFADIVTTALHRLGYSSEIASTARGTISIKNWKPIPVDAVPESTLMCTGDVLGELTSLVTLRIVILRTKPTATMEIKDKLLRLLVMQSHPLLRSTGCPLDEVSCEHPPLSSATATEHLGQTLPRSPSPKSAATLRRRFRRSATSR